MVELKITNIDNYIYELEDEKESKTYKFSIEFIDTDVVVDVGDYIYIKPELLDSKYEGYSYMYTFGSMDSKYGRDNLDENDIDVIKVVQNNKEISLKRLYG